MEPVLGRPGALASDDTMSRRQHLRLERCKVIIDVLDRITELSAGDVVQKCRRLIS